MKNGFWIADRNPMWDILIIGFLIVLGIKGLISWLIPNNELDLNNNETPETFIVRKGLRKAQYRIDGNEDGQIDIDEYLDENDEKITVRKDIDLNFDSYVDLIVYYNKPGIPYKVESPNNYYDLSASSSGVIIEDYIFEPKYIADDIKNGGKRTGTEFIEEFKYMNGELVYSEDRSIETNQLYSKTTYDGKSGDLLKLEMFLNGEWTVVIP
jgi:hypothetical protein